MDKSLSKKIIGKLIRFYGNPGADLKFSGIYQLTIAVVLSAQTTDSQVNSVTDRLFGKYPDFKSLSMADIGDVENIVRSTGFYKNKSKHIVALSKIITGKFEGKVPATRDDLMTLPGIGRKSANVILSIGYGIPAIAVDTHVSRIAKRLGYTDSTDPYKIEMALIEVIPERNWITTHLIFISHGRRLCKARKPLCRECPIIDLCPSADSLLRSS